MKSFSILIAVISIFLCRCGSEEDPFFPNRPIPAMNFPETADSAIINRNSEASSQILSSGEMTMRRESTLGSNDVRLKWLDSLNLGTSTTRQYYFEVFKRIAADPGQLSEGLLGTYLWNFLLHHPDEFMNHYKLMTSYERSEMSCYLSEGEKYSKIMNQSSYLKKLVTLTKNEKYPADLRKNLEILNYDIISYGSYDNE